MRHKEPWFKLWANDYLTDEKVDGLSLEAQGLLIRMWCVCSQRGNIPEDPEEIARLTCCKLQSVLKCHSDCKRFFELRDGMLYSGRMEREKARSAKARANVERRWGKETYAPANTNGITNGTTSGNTKSLTQKAREPESQKTESQRPESQRQAGKRTTRGTVPPGTIALVPVNPDSGEEMQAAVWLFDELGVPSDFGTRDMAAQAIRLQAREWGGTQAAAERILANAKAAKAKGETRWRFWFQETGYLGKSKSAERIGGKGESNIEALRQSIAEDQDSASGNGYSPSGED